MSVECGLEVEVKEGGKIGSGLIEIKHHLLSTSPLHSPPAKRKTDCWWEGTHLPWRFMGLGRNIRGFSLIE